MRATIRIDEGSDITGRVPNPEIAPRTGASQALCIKATKVGFERLWLIKMIGITTEIKGLVEIIHCPLVFYRYQIYR